jgi:putative hydrolase of the HAD superfamily
LRAGDAGPYAALVAGRDACLIDLYETLLSCDFSPNRRELPKLAGMAADAWNEAYAQLWAAVQVGRVSKAEAFGQTLRACGAQPSADLVRALVDRDRELQFASARLYDDAIPFLGRLRSGGLKVAIVSNCSEHTRPLLTELGVIALADAVILSCEVGAAKPSAEIYQRALDQLGVGATAALFVDDQAAFCAGAADLGIAAVQIVRGEPDGHVPTAGTAVVRSLTEVETMLWPSEGFKSRLDGEDRLRGLAKEVLSCLGR